METLDLQRQRFRAPEGERPVDVAAALIAAERDGSLDDLTWASGCGCMLG